MVEPLLYAALGFLTASLVALFMGRALWNRAVRLTTHRIMRRLPLSRDEIVASRDLLRAEVAIEHRKLERQANMMRQRMTQSMADVGRRDAAIVGMRATVEDARAKVADAETRVAAAKKTIEQLKSEANTLRSKLAKAEGGLTANDRAQRKYVDERAELLKLAEDRRTEATAAMNQVAQTKLIVFELEEQLKSSKAALADMDKKLEAAKNEKAGAEKQRGNDGEETALLRQQIERLATDIARVASASTRLPAPGGGVLQSAARASRDADQVATSFPPVR
jgi:archaellum component FlaC